MNLTLSETPMTGFLSKPFNESLDFPIVHSLMNHINCLTAQCQVNLPMQFASNIRCDTSGVVDNEPHLSRTCKTSFLFVPLAVRVHAGCSAFPFYTPTKPLIRLNIKYKIVLSPKL